MGSGVNNEELLRQLMNKVKIMTSADNEELLRRRAVEAKKKVETKFREQYEDLKARRKEKELQIASAKDELQEAKKQLGEVEKEARHEFEQIYATLQCLESAADPNTFDQA